MLKFINLKKLTAQTLFGLLIIGSFIAGTSTQKAFAGSCSNNGHGNNAPVNITLKDGTNISGTYDSSNPGNSANNQLTVRNSSGTTIAYNSLSNAQKTEFANKVQDIELHGQTGNGSKCSSASVDNALTVTIEAPTVQSSQLPAAGTYVVNFNDKSGTEGFTKTNGSTNYAYSGGLNVKNKDQWGGANESKYITQANGQTGFKVNVSQDQQYFGFWWSAGDAANKIIFNNNGQEVAVFQTRDLVKFIESQSPAQKALYYGNPNGGYGNTGHLAEPFAYVNVFFNNQAYDEIVIQTLTTSGAKFESDNHTFSAVDQDLRGTPVRRLATAMEDKISTNEDNPTNDDVLTNDLGEGLIVTKVNGDTTKVGNQVTLASGALLTLNSNGTFTYNPNSKFESLNLNQTDTDTFTYEIKDTGNNVSTATVTMTINGAADVPDAVPDSFSTNEDSSTTGNVKANDTDPNGDNLTVTMVNGVAANVGTQVTLASGALLTLNSNGTFTYNPNSKFESLNNGQNRPDTFTYTISDNHNNTASASVTMTITGVTDPVAD